MKLFTALALLAVVCAAPSASNAFGCNTCAPTCERAACPAPCPAVAAPVCMERVCQVCKCCPKITGFWG